MIPEGESMVCVVCKIDKPISKFPNKRAVLKKTLRVVRYYETQCRECNPFLKARKTTKVPPYPTDSKEYRKDAKLRSKYGINLSQYNTMVGEQQSRCLLCQTVCDQLVVDHDHATGKVRGLLCSRCNMGIGLFWDDAARISKAIEYLDAHN